MRLDRGSDPAPNRSRLTMPAPSSLPPSKKRKTSHSATIQRLEENVTSALAQSACLNALADLTNLASLISDAQDLHKAIYALYRVFVLIIELNRLCGASGEAEEAKLVRSWLNERLAEYTQLLCKSLRHEQKSIKVRCLASSYYRL